MRFQLIVPQYPQLRENPWGLAATPTSPLVRAPKDNSVDGRSQPNRLASYKLESMNAASCDLDKAPTLVATTSPFLNSMSVGMPRT